MSKNNTITGWYVNIEITYVY